MVWGHVCGPGGTRGVENGSAAVYQALSFRDMRPPADAGRALCFEAFFLRTCVEGLFLPKDVSHIERQGAHRIDASRASD
ncbi:hypothetical protein TRIP_B200147 [uncultured Desulfatiglans sp.]|nr:hypothetical protein TRIP_B200147 [uncultured Desulfatiglans sp.]